MALRIGGGKPAGPPPIEEDIAAVENAEAPVEEAPLPMEEEIPEVLPEDMMGMTQEEGLVSPLVAVYRGPEEGPFNCANCEFYGDGNCALVAGPIDPNGLCNLFTPVPKGEDMPTEESAEELPMEEEMPVEEPAAPIEE